MTKIFETLVGTENEPVSQTNGHRLGMGLAPDGTAPGTALGTQSGLRMDQRTRQELTRLIQNLFLRPGGARLVAFSGVQPGAGCSWLVVRIAELLGDAGAGSVCVVDANFRSPVLHSSPEAGAGCGFSDALVGTDPISAYVQRIGGRLHLLSSGSFGKRAAPLLASTAFRGRLDELRAKFDYVLFDTPPLAYRSDALAIASRIDGLALVVAANSTHRETARKAVKDVAAANVRMLGLILNKRTYPIPAALYERL